jgi:hypothetical protein
MRDKEKPNRAEEDKRRKSSEENKRLYDLLMTELNNNPQNKYALILGIDLNDIKETKKP